MKKNPTQKNTANSTIVGVYDSKVEFGKRFTRIYNEIFTL